MRFVDLDGDERLRIRCKIEDDFKGYCAGYQNDGILIAMPNNPDLCNGIHAVLNNAGFYGSSNPYKYFPLGSDTPPEILRHDGPYPGSKGYWKYVQFNPEAGREMKHTLGGMIPTLGMRFHHSRILSSKYDGTLLECEVSRIAQGVVYFRPVYGLHDDGKTWYGKSAYIPIENFHKIVACTGATPR